VTRHGALLAAGAIFAAAPSDAQTVGTCSRGGGIANQPQPVWILFDLDSAQIRTDDRYKIADAVNTAKVYQVTSLCIVGHIDKRGDNVLNERLGRARSQAVAAELVHAGYPGNEIVIAIDPEAFGNLSLGVSEAQERDRRVTIVFSR
jgi:outer membrane protein OmpA-like peptidoglycan-associated protein